VARDREHDLLLRKLIPKLREQDPEKWWVLDFSSDENPVPVLGHGKLPGYGRAYYTNIDDFNIILAEYTQEGSYHIFGGYRPNYVYCLHICEKDKWIATFSGASVEKLYSTVDPKVRKIKKSAQELQRHLEAIKERAQEEARQASLERLTKLL